MAGTYFLRNFPVWKTLQVVVSSVTHRWTLCQNRSSGRLGGNLRTTIFNRSFCCGWERCFSFSFLALAAFEGVEVATADITSFVQADRDSATPSKRRCIKFPQYREMHTYYLLSIRRRGYNRRPQFLSARCHTSSVLFRFAAEERTKICLTIILTYKYTTKLR